VSTNGDLVEVRLFGPLRQVVGEKSVSLPCAGMTIAEALRRFADDRGESVRPMLFDSQGNRLRSLILLLNNQTVEDCDTSQLRSGDVISILLPLAGG
jgi:molybdopterin converting factor small subunit